MTPGRYETLPHVSSHISHRYVRKFREVSTLELRTRLGNTVSYIRAYPLIWLLILPLLLLLYNLQAQ
jgi:hypothetical protein